MTRSKIPQVQLLLRQPKASRRALGLEALQCRGRGRWETKDAKRRQAWDGGFSSEFTRKNVGFAWWFIYIYLHTHVCVIIFIYLFKY